MLRREPALLPMELLWRWSFGLGLLALSFFAYSHLRQAILLSDTDEQALNGTDPFTFVTAAGNVIAQALPPLVRTLTQVFSAGCVLWIIPATLGRGIITRVLVRRFATEYAVRVAPDAPRWSAYAILKCARVLMLLIVLIGYLGGGYLAALVNPAGDSLALAALIVFAALAVSGVVWSYVNWLLSLSPIFVARDGLSALDSVVAAIAFARQNYSRLVSIAVWNSTLRGVAATVISLVGVSTAALRSSLPAWVVTSLLILETLAYLVISDAFLLARLAAYASVAVRELVLPQALSAADHSGKAVL